jgi:hypothetical protein
MKTITFETSGDNNETYELIIPEGYQKKELPYFKEWTEALDSGGYAQTSGQLCKKYSYVEGDETRYCCLGVLSKIQGRLTSDNTDSLDFDSTYYLSLENPNYPFLRENGTFPEGIAVISLKGKRIHNLAELNDNEFSFSQISKVIKEIWKEESLDNEQ